MMATYRPLVWTGPRTPANQRRSRYQFKAPWSATLDLLDRELVQLDASEVVIEADFREQDLRVDGMPRANARQPEFPGVKISFNAPGIGRVEYGTDAYELWQHNVRAIALSLEALRAVDRYGTTRGRQQYTGFKAIGGGTPMPTSRITTREQAATWLSEQAIESPLSGRSVVTAQDILSGGRARYAYRLAAQRLHPDAGGTTELFQRLQQAKAVLDV